MRSSVPISYVILLCKVFKEERRCQTKGANGRWAGYGRVLGGLRGGQASGMLRAGFGPHEPLF